MWAHIYIVSLYRYTRKKFFTVPTGLRYLSVLYGVIYDAVYIINAVELINFQG